MRSHVSRRSRTRGAQALEIRAEAAEPFRAPDVIAEIDPAVALGQPRVALSADRREAVIDVPLGHALPANAKLAGRTVVLTLVDGERALETKPRTIAQGASAAQETGGPSVLAMLGIALLGGLILNLMPCVLPVLSLKFISVVSQGGPSPPPRYAPASSRRLRASSRPSWSSPAASSP